MLAARRTLERCSSTEQTPISGIDPGARPSAPTTMAPGGVATIFDTGGDQDAMSDAIFAGTTTNSPIVIAVIAIAARLQAALGIAMS